MEQALAGSLEVEVEVQLTLSHQVQVSVAALADLLLLTPRKSSSMCISIISKYSF